MEHDSTFGQVVRERRSLLGLTQAELARRAGCAPITIRKMEGDTLRPSVQLAELLALALNIPEAERSDFVRLARQEKAPTPIPRPTPAPSEIGLDDLSGRAVKGFQLAELIGSGGFGVVYRAVQPSVQRDVAVKIILPRYANHPSFIRRFEAEAHLVARLEHPHIVPLYDYWREPNAAYLIMRLLRGGSLDSLLQRGPFSLELFRRMVQQIGQALAAAHVNNVVHRDIKPANVLLDEAQNAYLGDFGIAKYLEIAGEAGLTDDGALIGSPAYISPEQIQNEPIRPSSDIYCFGLLLFEMLTGQKPFPGPTPLAYLQQHLNEPVPSLLAIMPNLPPALDEIVRRASAKQPSDRFADMTTLLGSLEHVLARSVVEISPLLTGQATAVPLPTTQEIAALDNPYCGLRAFTESDANNFFGRETLVQELLDRLSDGNDLERFMAVVGPSGSGKSSLVKAGLLPALRRGGLPGSDSWFMVDLTPGSQPWQEMEAALLRVAVNPPDGLLELLQADNRGLLRAVRRCLPDDGETELLLLIDQFEELFTLVADEAVRAHFLQSLVTAVLDPNSRLRVVLTMRADFTDRPLQYVDFGELIEQRLALVLPLTPDELTQAITRPVENLGMAMTPELVATIIRDVGDQPGMLPLLQYALTELFEQRQSRTITLDDYRETGGVTGALARRADEIFNHLDAAGQAAARQIFLRLITLGEGVEDTRRRVLLAELEALSVNDQPITKHPSPNTDYRSPLTEYGKYRLLTFDHDPVTRGPTVEVAHEALLREWPRLRGWLDESRSDIRLQRLLAAANTEWRAAKQDESFLLRGSRLDQFADWSEYTNLALTGNEHAYLEASLEARRKRETAEAARQAREGALEQRSIQRLRVIVAVLIVASIMGVILTTAVFNQSQTARRNETVALQNAATATIAQGEALFQAATAESAEARAETQAALAVTRAAEAAASAVEAQGQRRIALEQQSIAEQEARAALEAYSLSLAVHALQALTDLDSGTALALALAASNIEDSPREVIETLKQVAFAPGARRQYTITDDNGESIPIGSIAVSPDGRTALAGLENGNVILLDIETGETLGTFAGHTESVQKVIFSPDGQMALSGGCDAEAILWEIVTGKERQRFSGHSGCVYALDFSPDGRQAVSGGFNSYDEQKPGDLILWDVESGELTRRFEGGHLYGVYSAVFSPDGSTLLSGGSSYGARGWEYGDPLLLWNVESGEIIQRFPAPNEFVLAIAINPNGGTALSVAINKIYLWDLQTGEELHVFEGLRSNIRSVDFSPDGRWVMASNSGGDILLWDIASGQLLFEFAQTDTAVATFLPDGRTALSGSADGSLVLWDLFNAAEVRRFEGHAGGINDVAFTPDGAKALSLGGIDPRFNFPGQEDNSLRVWNVATGEQIQLLEGHTDMGITIDISPDGSQALSTAFDGTVRLWDLGSGGEISHFEFPYFIFDVSFSPDGKQALTATGEPSVLLWDLERGEILKYFYGHTIEGDVAIFSPDGKTALSGGLDGTMILWDLESGEQIRRFWREGNFVLDLVFSRDGRLIVEGDGENVVVWDMETREIVRVFSEHQDFIDINMVDLGADGRTIASSDISGVIYVWDWPTGEVLHRFASREALPVYIALSPDGRYLLSGSQDHTVILWDLQTYSQTELQEWITANRVVRELTCEERGQYGIEPLCPETDETLLTVVSATNELEVPYPTHNAQVGENRGEITLGGFDIWLYQGIAGEALTIRLNADSPTTIFTPADERLELGQMDTLLFVIAPDGRLLGVHDNIESGNTNSMIGDLVLPINGTYRIEARSYGDQTTGAYSLLIESALP